MPFLPRLLLENKSTRLASSRPHDPVGPQRENQNVAAAAGFPLEVRKKMKDRTVVPLSLLLLSLFITGCRPAAVASPKGTVITAAYLEFGPPDALCRGKIVAPILDASRHEKRPGLVLIHGDHGLTNWEIDQRANSWRTDTSFLQSTSMGAKRPTMSWTPTSCLEPSPRIRSSPRCRPRLTSWPGFHMFARSESASSAGTSAAATLWTQPAMTPGCAVRRLLWPSRYRRRLAC